MNESDRTTQESSAAINLSAPPPPDLAASAVTTSLGAAQSGQSESVTWKVTNVGGSPATGSWTDSVYVSPDGSLADATLLGTENQAGGLAAGSSYSGALTATLPSSLADGNSKVLVVTDSADAVVADPYRANNEASSPQSLNFGHVDLVPSITVAPAAAMSGASITVTWSTTNRGTATTLSGWVEIDAIIASPTNNFADPNAVILADYPHTTPLAPGISYTQTQTVQMPPGFTGATISSSRPTLVMPSSRTARRQTTSVKCRITST